jgi:hypothetical protein
LHEPFFVKVLTTRTSLAFLCFGEAAVAERRTSAGDEEAIGGMLEATA